MAERNLNSWSGTGVVKTQPQFVASTRLTVFDLLIAETHNGKEFKTGVRIKNWGSQFDLLQETLSIGVRVAITGALVEDHRSTREGIRKELIVHAQKILLISDREEIASIKETVHALVSGTPESVS